MSEASEDVNPTSSNLTNQTFVNFTNLEITITYVNPNHHQTLASAYDTQAMDILEIVITENQTQTYINPPLIIDTNLILRSVCIEIFKSLIKLVEARKNVIQLVNYTYKWDNFKKLVDNTLDNLKEMAIASQQEAL